MVQLYGDPAILNRGSADLWYYPTESEVRPAQVVKVPLGGEPVDAVAGSYGTTFIADAAAGSVTQLDLKGGAEPSLRSIPVGEDPVDLALGQLLPDRELELAVADRGSDTVTILDSPPSGIASYPTYSRAATLPAGDEPDAVLWANVDGKDGADLAVADAGSDRLLLFLSDGHGHLHRAASYKTGRDPVAVSAIDSFDESFGRDLIVANHRSKTLTVLERHYSALCRGREARPITGTAGDDTLRGEAYPDLIRGLGGDDSIAANSADDCLKAGPATTPCSARPATT